MKVTVNYGESKKDAAGNLFTYRAEITKEFDESALTPEQALAKMRQYQTFLHAEIHKNIEAEQIKDGVLNPKDAIHLKATNGNG